MSRPLALIEGDLALPTTRPFDGLPPPFGTWQRAKLAQRRVPPGVKYVLSYKVPPPKMDSRRFDAAMAEAKRFMEMGTARPRSSRSDYLLGATIVAGCSIALTWLIFSCSMRDAKKAQALAESTVAPIVVSKVTNLPPLEAKQNVEVSQATHPVESKPESQTVVVVPSTSPAPATKALVEKTLVKLIEPAVVEIAQTPSARRKRTTQTPVQSYAAPPRAKPKKTIEPTRITAAHLGERLALSRTARPAVQVGASKQPEWAAPAAQNDDTSDQAQLRNWATQQRRANLTTRAATSVPGDIDWNARMTQRRITDSPEAFRAGSGTPQK